ncbi:diacylglycerol kinase family lipid kinase [Streptomonospora sp. S1-112]|uniref:Diacylglycerol kinase family lipid kinase n=1 Tax=Streptomonospora mangrovi TaxID=2883123 RepID=A0A9X3SDQ9_9ACTN|nr:diacylglycerol kinase family protein [Streptomonospora mangrovi]MDA0562935.1 diacylglycerol kinase family lipid kinase [Streptomonospora mangrovi]
MRALFIVNPQATTTTPRSRDVLVGAIAREMELDVAQTEYRDHARELAQQAAGEGYELVISLGGDGTVNEVVNGLLTTPADLPRPSFAALPGGSANVFIRALGLPADPIEATGAMLEAVRSGERRTVGLGRVLTDQDDRYFTFCAGFGWDADVVHEVERQRRQGRRASPALYMALALKKFLRGEVAVRSLRIEAPGRDPVRDLYFALVTNTTPWTYAGAVPVQPTPRSRFELGLDLFALTQMNTARTAQLLRQMLSHKGVPPYGPGFVTWHDQSEVTITSRSPRAFQIDGEYLGHRRRVNLQAVPKALRIVG